MAYGLWQKKTREGIQYLWDIHRKTKGRCVYCNKQLPWDNYGADGTNLRGRWEVDHDIPWIDGGPEDFKNLWPACWPCNREKSNKTGLEYKQFLNDRGYTATQDRTRQGWRVNSGLPR